VSVLLVDNKAEINYALGNYIGKDSEPLVCRLEDGVVLTTGLIMIMYHGDPLMKRVTEIIDHVVEAGIYNYWISLRMNMYKLHSRKIAIANPLDRYYSFNLYHMQPAFYLILMGWCLSAICFIVELFYNLVLTKRK
jgi:glycosyltransferase involved in cell wall biosynthesis